MIKLGDKKTTERERIEEEIKETDKEIDELVYNIYGITEEEKKVIEGGFGVNFFVIIAQSIITLCVVLCAIRHIRNEKKYSKKFINIYQIISRYAENRYFRKRTC